MNKVGMGVTNGHETDLDRLLDLGCGLYLLIHSGPESIEQARRIRERHAGARIIVRRVGGVGDPPESVAAQIAGVYHDYWRVAQVKDWIAWNEPDRPEEGGFSTRSVAEWARQFLPLLRQKCPGVIAHFGAWANEQRYQTGDMWEWINVARAYDVVDFHAYSLSYLRAYLDWHKTFLPSNFWFCSEFNFGLGNGKPEHYGAMLYSAYDMAYPYVNSLGVTPFIWRWVNPEPGGDVLNICDDGEAQRWIESAVADLPDKYDPAPTPPVPPTPDPPIPDPNPQEDSMYETTPERGAFFAGSGMVIWYVDPVIAARHGNSARCAHGGDMNALADGLMRLNVNWVTIKVADGDSYWTGQAVKADELRRILWEKGSDIRVIPWTYVYSGNADHSTWTGESIVNRRALRDFGSLIIDVEVEADGKWQETEWMMAQIREEFPEAPIAYCPIPIIDYNPNLPWVQYQQTCDAVLPQFYVDLLGSGNASLWPIDRMYDIWEKWHRNWADRQVPVLPLYPMLEVFSVHDPRATRLRGYAEACLARGALGLSGWEYVMMGPEAREIWADVGELLPALPPVDPQEPGGPVEPGEPTPPVGFDREAAGADLNALWGVLERLATLATTTANRTKAAQEAGFGKDLVIHLKDAILKLEG